MLSRTRFQSQCLGKLMQEQDDRGGGGGDELGEVGSSVGVSGGALDVGGGDDRSEKSSGVAPSGEERSEFPGRAYLAAVGRPTAGRRWKELRGGEHCRDDRDQNNKTDDDGPDAR